MVGDQENILVELDYDNISLIDPNKVVDQQGNVSDRLVKQENQVFYANLECNVLPRTKLAVGTALNDSSRTISVGKINFLNGKGDGPFDVDFELETPLPDKISEEFVRVGI